MSAPAEGKRRGQVPAFAAITLLALAACGARDRSPVQALGGGPDVSRFGLMSLKGTRDADRLAVRAVFADGGAALTVNLRFAIGVPTHLESGTWNGLDGAGEVRERSVTFLGGQSGPPSVGGRFDLVGPDGRARYRVTIPVQELKNRL